MRKTERDRDDPDARLSTPSGHITDHVDADVLKGGGSVYAGKIPAKLLGARRSGAQILQAQILSASSLPCNRLHFPQETGLHVENEASHRDIFRDPGMRSYLIDLLLSVPLEVVANVPRLRRESISDPP